MSPLSSEKPPLWAATAEGAGGWGMEDWGPRHCLLVTKARGSKGTRGTERRGEGPEEGPRTESEGRGSSHRSGEGAPNLALLTPVCSRYFLLPTSRMRIPRFREAK